jgi:hypothetical protein
MLVVARPLSSERSGEGPLHSLGVAFDHYSRLSRFDDARQTLIIRRRFPRGVQTTVRTMP